MKNLFIALTILFGVTVMPVGEYGFTHGCAQPKRCSLQEAFYPAVAREIQSYLDNDYIHSIVEIKFRTVQGMSIMYIGYGNSIEREARGYVKLDTGDTVVIYGENYEEFLPFIMSDTNRLIQPEPDDITCCKLGTAFQEPETKTFLLSGYGEIELIKYPSRQE